MRHFPRRLTTFALFVALAQVANAQGPIGTRPYSGASASEQQKIADALAIAKLIGNARGGAAKNAVEAWEKAKNDGRLVIIEVSVDTGISGWTWPDAPIGGLQPAGKKAVQGEYWISQTMFQFTGLMASALADLCPCAVAILILHEGMRLDQTGPASAGPEGGPNYWANGAAIAKNTQDITAEDIRNINEATKPATPPQPGGPCAGVDADCKEQLAKMKEKRIDLLKAANVQADTITRATQGAISVEPKPIPQ